MVRASRNCDRRLLGESAKQRLAVRVQFDGDGSEEAVKGVSSGVRNMAANGVRNVFKMTRTEMLQD